MDYTPKMLVGCQQALRRDLEAARVNAIGRLRLFEAPGIEVARQIDGLEAHMLLAAHMRIPHSILEFIDPLKDPMQVDEDERLFPPTNYACNLAGEIQLLTYVGSDRYFPGPESTAEMARVDKLINRLTRLTPPQSMALHVLMDAAVVGFVGTISYYGNWWYPPMLLRILANPELDRQIHHT